VTEATSLHPAQLAEAELLRECNIRFVRRSGPGGQHRNKVATGVQLVHRGTGVVAEANERRSQAQNRSAAIQRLRLRLAVDVRRHVSVSATPSPLWQSRCRNGRLSINPSHLDLAALLAEALDRIAALGWDVRAAAGRLGCTPTQLVRLLQFEPPAVQRVNRERAARGLRPLH
jgi:hypothetical protein